MRMESVPDIMREYIFALLKGKECQIRDTKIKEIIRTEEGRKCLVRNLELFRGEICLSASAFDKLADICSTVLEIVDKTKEWNIAKVIMHMSSNFYFVDEKGEYVFLQSCLKYLSIWSKIDFWNEAYYSSLQDAHLLGNTHDSPENMPKWKDLDSDSQNSKIEREKNLAYGQCCTFILNMLNFGVSIESTRVFLVKQSEMNDFDDETRNALINLAESTQRKILSEVRERSKRENEELLKARKKLWKMQKHNEWKKAREDRMRKKDDPEDFLLVDSSVTNTLYGSPGASFSANKDYDTSSGASSFSETVSRSSLTMDMGKEFEDETSPIEIKRELSDLEEDEETQKLVSTFKEQWLNTKKKNWQKEQERRERAKREDEFNTQVAKGALKPINSTGKVQKAVKKHKTIISNLESLLDGANSPQEKDSDGDQTFGDVLSRESGDSYASFSHGKLDMYEQLKPVFQECTGKTADKRSEPAKEASPQDAPLATAVEMASSAPEGSLSMEIQPQDAQERQARASSTKPLMATPTQEHPL